VYTLYLANVIFKPYFAAIPQRTDMVLERYTNAVASPFGVTGALVRKQCTCRFRVKRMAIIDNHKNVGRRYICVLVLKKKTRHVLSPKSTYFSCMQRCRINLLLSYKNKQHRMNYQHKIQH